jgi:LacI family transcriptional regulator
MMRESARNHRGGFMEKTKVTMKDVAKYAGVAIGTVDRVLNNTGFVSGKKRQLVLEAIQALNYVPNKVASALSKQQIINIAVVYVYPNIENYFWELINKGIKNAEKQFEAYGLRIIRRYVDSYKVEDQIAVINELLEEYSLHGLAFVPLHPVKLNELIDNLTSRGIPVVTFDSDATLSKRLCFIGDNAVKGGSIAGKLMGLFLGGKGNVVIMRGQKNLLPIQQRITGFMEKIAAEFPDVKIVDSYDIYDDQGGYEKRIYNIISQIFSDSPVKIDGIFVTNTLIGLVGKAIKDIGIQNVKLIGFDYSETVETLLKEDMVSATICTDLNFEGYEAIRILYEYITAQVKPKTDCIFTKYEIMIKETL